MKRRPASARRPRASQAATRAALLALLLLATASGSGCARRGDHAATTAAAAPSYDAEALARIKSETARDFPDLDHAATATVEAWMADGRPLVLLDVREPEEYAVSHLQSARQVDPGASAQALQAGPLAGVPKDARIVAYCSVGVRSARLAQRLQEAGFSDVHNLAGSIFEWANDGRAVYRDGTEVVEVHPYDEQWGRLLDAARHPD